MECISELKDSLNAYFGWNKARMACFVNMLLALLATRTVNLNKLACVVFGEAQQSSRYRRIQRFFSKFPLDYQQIAGFIFKLFLVSGGQWYLSMDRTNWRWGKSDINILMLGIVFKGTAIPIYWILLDKLVCFVMGLIFCAILFCAILLFVWLKGLQKDTMFIIWFIMKFTLMFMKQ